MMRLQQCLEIHGIRETGCSTGETTVGAVLAAVLPCLVDGRAFVQHGTEEKASKCLLLLWCGGGLTVRALPPDFAIFLKTFQFKSPNPPWKKKVLFLVICYVTAAQTLRDHPPLSHPPCPNVASKMA